MPRGRKKSLPPPQPTPIQNKPLRSVRRSQVVVNSPTGLKVHNEGPRMDLPQLTPQMAAIHKAALAHVSQSPHVIYNNDVQPSVDMSLFNRRTLVRRPNAQDFRRDHEDPIETIKRDVAHIKGRFSLMDRKLNRMRKSMEALQRMLEHEFGFHIVNEEEDDREHYEQMREENQYDHEETYEETYEDEDEYDGSLSTVHENDADNFSDYSPVPSSLSSISSNPFRTRRRLRTQKGKTP